jgi:predicted glycosyltransferase involved in capsule biosynthesis
MKKSIAALIDELSVTNIKIYHLAEKIKNDDHTPEDAKTMQALNNLHSELCKALDRSTTMNPVRNKKSEIFADTPKASRIYNGMKKTLSALVDEITVTNIKIYHLVDKITKDEHTREDAKRAQDLNRYRSELCNVLNREFKERENIKI